MACNWLTLLVLLSVILYVLYSYGMQELPFEMDEDGNMVENYRRYRGKYDRGYYRRYLSPYRWFYPYYYNQAYPQSHQRYSYPYWRKFYYSNWW